MAIPGWTAGIAIQSRGEEVTKKAQSEPATSPEIYRPDCAYQ
jgi:hypothetical protein